MIFEDVLITNLVRDGENFGRKVLAFLNEEYFAQEHHKTLFKVINGFFQKYSAFPSTEALDIELQALDGLNEDVFNQSKELIKKFDEIEVSQNSNQVKWLVDKTESFCQDRAIFLAIHKSIKILDKKEKELTKGAIPKLLSDALGVSFDTHIGHDYLEDAVDRWESYHTVHKKIPFDLRFLNIITDGGVLPKTLTVLMASTGVGKSLSMCHMAACNLEMGYNVLYITAEMSEDEVSKRIDANRFELPFNELMLLSKEQYVNWIEGYKRKTTGKLVIKEYPTASSHVGHYRHLLNELKLKKRFIPDIIYIDYINICTSSRIKFGQGVNSYTFIKSVAEEFRGLGVEFGVPVITATQVNREGSKASDFGLEETSESWGLPATADYFLAIQTNEEVEKRDQLIFKQLKNRYNSIVTNKRFTVGIRRDIFRLYDVEQESQEQPIVTNVPSHIVGMETGRVFETFK